MKKTGLFGGTFDPIHYGHLELARNALRLCDLSEIVFIPSGVPPHKTGAEITPFQHRVKMLKLATRKDPGFSISTIEERLASPTFTVDTLNLFFRKKVTQDYYFILGVDAFLDIRTWKQFEKVLNGINFIVATRSGYAPELFYEFMKKLCYDRYKTFWCNKKSGMKTYFLDIEIPGISSSGVREGIKRNSLSAKLISPSVLKYITKHSLYSSEFHTPEKWRSQ